VKARKPGRPRLDPDSTKETVITIRLSRDERAAIAEAAERAGDRGASEWARRVLLAAAAA
jgi:uncharacterized protein (DUF1778 family)